MGRKERTAQIPPKVRRGEPAREPITAPPCVPRARQMWPPVFFVGGGPSTQRAASDFGTKASPGGDADAAEQNICLRALWVVREENAWEALTGLREREQLILRPS